MTADAEASGAGETISWSSSEVDRLAEVDHVDGRRRPWRSAGVALAALALGAVVVPRPLSAPAVGAIGVGALLAAIAAWRLPIIRGRREPVVADLALTVDPRGVVVERGGLERRLAPRAIRQLVVGSDHVFLHLPEGEVLTIPCRVFSARGALDRFVEHLERFRRRGQPPQDPPEPGCDRWILAYGEAGRRTSDPASDRERWVLIGFAVVSFLVLLASTEPWRGGLDLVLMALFGAIGLVFVVAGHRPRLPVGPVTLALGPGGGFMRTRMGIARFGWARVSAVEVVQDGVVLRFVDQLIPIPSAALPGDRQGFVDDLQSWWHEARRPPGRPSVAASPDLDDPFAPPRG